MPREISNLYSAPDSPIASVINKPSLRANRSLSYSEVRLHVSDLIKTDTAFAFCIRQHVIQKLFKPMVIPAALSASYDLLFDLGNCLHDNARNRWMRYDKHGDRRVLARWSCLCGDVKHEGVNPRAANVCKRCLSYPSQFDEHEIIDKEFNIVAHPDFSVIRGESVISTGQFVKERDMVRVVEIKGIDRAEIDWKTLDGPLGEHTLQGSMYYHIYKRAGYRTDKIISYLYGERSLKETLFRGEPWKEFQVEVSPFSRVQPIFAKAKAVNDFIAEKVVPERKLCSTVDCTRAKNCPVATLCFGIDENGYKKAKKIVGQKRSKKKPGIVIPYSRG